MVTAGLCGRKTGRGFYTYESPDSPVVVVDAQTAVEGGTDGDVRQVQSVGVVGSGVMAVGVAEIFARGGFDVIVRARGDEQAARAHAMIARSLEKAVVRDKITEQERDAALAHITTSRSFDDLSGCDLVLEATAEELTVKQAVFSALDEVLKPGAILATTTSSLPVIEIAAATSRMPDVVGLHFFNPAPVMGLVEVVRTISTADDVVATARAVCARLGKRSVTCGDRAGFVVNALLFPYLNDAVRMLEVRYATADDIDNAMKVGCGYPMGPFELLDVIGLDVALAIQRMLYLEFREPGFAPAPLLEHLVTAGYLGRKSGRGFRVYT
jgi:3-hydroxybutyryl-CoA dehydrogenase